MLLALATVFLFQPIPAPAAEKAWLLMEVEGKDRGGKVVKQKFELSPDGVAKWDEAGGFPCGEDSLQLRLSPKQSERITDLARKAAEAPEEKAGDPNKEPMHSLVLSLPKKTQQFFFARNSNRWSDFLRELEFVRREELSQVVFTAGKGGGEVSASFTLVGKNSLAFLLPKKAEDAFKVEGHKVKYSTPPDVLEFSLDPHHKTFRVDLVLDPAAKGGESLRYSNRELLKQGHRSDKGDFQPVVYCSTI